MVHLMSLYIYMMAKLLSIEIKFEI